MLDGVESPVCNEPNKFDKEELSNEPMKIKKTLCEIKEKKNTVCINLTSRRAENK